MDNYNQTYYYLFNRITDLIEEMKSIQQTAEEMFITFAEKPSCSQQEQKQ